MNKLLAWFSPERWIALVLVVLALCGGGYWLYESIKQSGRDEIQAKWDQAVADAEKVQQGQNKTATVEHATETGAAQVIYKTKIQKVIEYVASNQKRDGADAVVCPADAQFISLFNDPGPAR